MKQKKMTFSVLDIVVVGLMAALVFVFTNFRIEIPTPLGKTMLHLGNVMCLLSGMLFGPLRGGLAAGFGSMLFDLFDPQFVAESWITFIMKFIMALVAGVLARAAQKHAGRQALWRFVLAAVCGALSYVVVYLLKQYVENYVILGVEWETVLGVLITKGSASLANGAVAAVASVLLNSMMRPALKKAGLSDRLRVR